MSKAPSLKERLIGPDRYRALMKRWVEARRRSGSVVPAVQTDIYLFGEDNNLSRLFPNAVKLTANETICSKLSEIEISLVVTFKDELDSIEDWVTSLAKQTVKPTELVLVDASSSLSISSSLQQRIQSALSSARLRVVHQPNCNIATGRNIGVREAMGGILVFTDLGCTMDSHWLERLITPFVHNPEVELSKGWYEVVTRSAFSHCFSNYTVPRLGEIEVDRFIPSARSFAIRREQFSLADGFPEYLSLAGEDSLFGYYLHFVVKRAAFVPEALVRWDFPDGPLRIFRVISRYAAGDAEGGRISWQHYLDLVRNVLRFPIIVLRYPQRSNASRWLNVRAVSLLLAAQLFGFVSGYLRRHRVFLRRIGRVRGIVFLISSEPVSDRAPERLSQLWSWLKMDYFVVNVYSLAGAAAAKCHRIFEHQRLLSFLRTEFDLERFLTSVGKDILATNDLVVADVMQDGASRELKDRIKLSFPERDVREA